MNQLASIIKKMRDEIVRLEKRVDRLENPNGISVGSGRSSGFSMLTDWEIEQAVKKVEESGGRGGVGGF